jgi:hypothetical protein
VAVQQAPAAHRSHYLMKWFQILMVGAHAAASKQRPAMAVRDQMKTT